MTKDNALAFVGQIMTAYKAVMKAEGQALKYAIECGEALNRAKENVESTKPKGKWNAWLKEICSEIQPRTERLYRQLATAVAENPDIFADCESIRSAVVKLQESDSDFEEDKADALDQADEDAEDESGNALPITSTAAKAVALLNQKHHVIGNYGNKCVILSWELWEINRNVMIPTFQRFEDFTHRYMNRYVSVQTDEGSRKVPAGKFWLSHPGRKTYDSVVFRPNEPVVLSDNRLNLWRGWGVPLRKGSWKLMRAHIYDVLGAGDPTGPMHHDGACGQSLGEGE